MRNNARHAGLVLLLLPTLACADFSSERAGQTSGASSLLLQPQVAFLSREPAPLLFSTPSPDTRLGVALSFPQEGPPTYSITPAPLERFFSATAFGTFALTQRIDVFGKLGLRYLAQEVGAINPIAANEAHLSKREHRYGLGMSVRANKVLSLHFEWERTAQGGTDVTGGSVPNALWEPWRERNVFGAGMRLGF